MKIFYRLGLLAMSVLLFQNCGSFETNELGLVYSYTSKPRHFYDLKLVKVEKDELGRETFEFDLAISHAVNFDAPVSFFVAYSTLARSSSCPTSEHRAEGNTKHQRFICKIPVPDDLYIELSIFEEGQEPEVAQFRF